MSYVPFFSHGDAATEAPDTDEADLCPQCGHEWEGTTQCRSCGYGEPEPKGPAVVRYPNLREHINARLNEPEWCRCATVPGVPHAPKWCAFLRAEKPEVYRRRGGEG